MFDAGVASLFRNWENEISNPSADQQTSRAAFLGMSVVGHSHCLHQVF